MFLATLREVLLSVAKSADRPPRVASDLDPAAGIMCGLLLGAILWIVIIVVFTTWS